MAGTYFDYPALFLVLFLVAFGLIMVYSTSSYMARITADDAAYYFKRQGIVALLGIFVMVMISFIVRENMNHSSSMLTLKLLT